MKKEELKRCLELLLESLSDEDDIEVSSSRDVSYITNKQTGKIEKIVPEGESEFVVKVKDGKDSFDDFAENIRLGKNSKYNPTELCGRLSSEQVDNLLKG